MLIRFIEIRQFRVGRCSDYELPQDGVRMAVQLMVRESSSPVFHQAEYGIMLSEDRWTQHSVVHQ